MTQQPPTFIRDAAIRAIHAGLSAIRVNPKTKAPVGTWKQYQTQAMTPDHAQAIAWAGMGIVCGKVSGGLECLDFDHKARLLAPWKALVDAEAPGLADRLTRQITQSGGRHIVYRCPGVEIPGNQKLAHGEPGQCLIETRGEGGQFLAAPTPGYELIHGSWEEPPIVTPEERETMIRAALSLDKQEAAPRPCPAQDAGSGDRPGDLFNEQGDPLPILLRHGWTDTGITNGHFRHLRRPGKDQGWSASLIDGRIFNVFSTSAAPFEAGKGYSPFQVLTLLEHGGDFSEAARRLRDVCDVSKNKRRAQETSNSKGCDVIDVCDVSFKENETCTALPPAPIHLFHPEVAHILEQVAQAKGCPVEAAMAACMAACAGLIGRKRKLRIKQGWSERGNLYLALIARSGIGKSPGTKFFFKPIHKLEKGFQLTFQAKLEEYEEKLSEWTKESKKKGGKPGKKPLPPQREDILVDDWTTESLTDALAANPRGILAYRDELAGLFLELDKYAGQTGGTKNRFMEAYDSGPWKTSRINKARISYIPNACLSIYGTIQPIQAKEIFTGKDKATGFLARFILINASQKAPAYFNMKSEDERSRNTWKALVNGLHSLPFDEEEDLRNMIDCTNEAREHFSKWHDELETEKWLGENDSEDSMLSKLRGQCLRLALHFHLVDCILDRKDNMAPLSVQTMQRACLLTDWIKSHARAAWNILKGSAALPSGQEMRVGTAILALTDQIKNGVLLTSLIAAQVNKGLEKRFHLSAKAVGKACGKLGLEKQDTRAARGWTVTPEDIARLMDTLETNVANVDNVASKAGQGLPGATFENANVANVATNVADVEVF